MGGVTDKNNHVQDGLVWTLVVSEGALETYILVDSDPNNGAGSLEDKWILVGPIPVFGLPDQANDNAQTSGFGGKYVGWAGGGFVGPIDCPATATFPQDFLEGCGNILGGPTCYQEGNQTVTVTNELSTYVSQAFEIIYECKETSRTTSDRNCGDCECIYHVV